MPELGGKPANDNQSCPKCGGHLMHWEQDNGWLTRPLRYLRCQSCGECVRLALPFWGVVLYVIMLAIIVGYGWSMMAR